MRILVILALAGWLQAPADADHGAAADLSFNEGDLDFVLKQIKIAERHAAGEELLDILPNATVPLGLRTVDGSYNNIIPGQTGFGQADLEFPKATLRVYKDAQPLTQAMAANDVVGDDTSYSQGDGRTVEDSTARLISHLITNQSVANPAAVIAAAEEDGENIGPDLAEQDQFFIPNTAVDEGLSAPFNAFMTFFGQFFDHGLDLVNKGGNGLVFMPLQPDDPLYDIDPASPNMNFMLMPRATLDAGPDGVIGTADDVSNPINATTPHVDQQQTYASHSSAQVFLRHYELRDGRPESTGRLLNGYGNDALLDTADDHGMATWDTAQLQAQEKLGIDLDDNDGANVPMIAADPYGNFIPGPDRGLPMIVTPAGMIEGDLMTPIDATAAIRVNHSYFLDVAHTANPGGKSPDENSVINASTNTLSGQPTRGIREEGAPLADGTATYDDELLGAHFVCGDGRCNENIALTTIHSVFHREHNRLCDVVKRVLLDAGDLVTLNEWLDTQGPDGAYGTADDTPLVALPAWAGLPFPVSDASLDHQETAQAAIDALALDWNGERIFQAARFGTEMQYNRVVFDEFVPTLAGLKDPFTGFDSRVNPSITAEFSQSVYRFGHSMLVQAIDRYTADFAPITYQNSPDQLGLFEAFLNPLALFNSDEAGNATLTAEEGTGAVVRGLTRQTGNEIDEFVTGAMQNNLVGLPLDIGAINIARGRDVGNPPLNTARRMFYAETMDARLAPYVNWVDYLDNLRHEPSFVNFLAAYGTHPSLAGDDGIVGNDDDPNKTYADRRAAACAIAGALTLDAAAYCTGTGFGVAATPGDAMDFLFGTGAWENDADGEIITGLEDVDFWNGGLAEERMPFGGYLGSTHNFVFEKQMESLQNGDRFYYVGRTKGTGLDFFAELESNSFTALVMRNTDLGISGGGSLPLNLFSVPHHFLEADQTQQFNGIDSADPANETDLVPLVIRDPARATIAITVADPNLFVQYTGGDHVVIGGTDGDDTLVGGIGDDAIWGRAGNDRIEGGDGADLIEGGPGDDIITDLSGPDVIEGGDGNDAIFSGNEEDVIFGDDGKDFIVNPSEEGEVFGGEGDDFALDGIHNSKFIMGPGDDWLEELGGGENIHAMDNSKQPEAGEGPTKGNDVYVAFGGNNDMDMENGDDIMVDGPGVDRMEGQLGFDWASFQNDLFGVNVDLDLNIFVRPILPPSNASIGNRYDRVEGLSGSPFGDILKGTPNSAVLDHGNELSVNASRDGFALITGLTDGDIPGVPGLVPMLERGVLALDPVTGEAQSGWTGGEIILGGGGSDLMVGEGGDDIIDGDSALTVALRVGTDLYAGMQDLMGPVFDGTISPGDIYISRVIGDEDDANVDTDTALFQGNRADYLVAEVYDGNFIQVLDLRGLPTNLKDNRPGSDGDELLRNVERLSFADQTIVLAADVAGSAGDLNSLAVGAPTIEGVVALGSELTASVAAVTDADNTSSGGAVDPAGVDWIWESEIRPGFFAPIVRLGGAGGNGDPFGIHGRNFVVTVDEIGRNLRVVAILQDEAGVFEVVRSDTVSVPVPPGFVAPPGVVLEPAISFNGVCTDLSEPAGFAPDIIVRAAGDGRLDATIMGVPLSLFSNTAAQFTSPFGTEAEDEVPNITLTFVTDASGVTTGIIVPQITAIVNPDGSVDQDNVDISWAIAGAVLQPLVNGPTTATFSLAGCGTFATATLDGDSTFGNLATVTVITVNQSTFVSGGPTSISATVGADGRVRITGNLPAGRRARPDTFAVTCITDLNGGFRCGGTRLPVGDVVTIVQAGGLDTTSQSWTGTVDSRGKVRLTGNVRPGNNARPDQFGVSCSTAANGRFRCTGLRLPVGQLVTVIASEAASPGVEAWTGTVDSIGRVRIVGNVGAGNQAEADAVDVNCTTNANGRFRCGGRRLPPGQMVTVTVAP